MAEGAARRQAAGSIYDLGYRRYEGARLGRRSAALALFAYTFRAIWGIGRSWLAKLFPIGLFVIVMVPAVVVVAMAALAPEDYEIVKAEEVYGLVAIVMALFCAVAAPELVGRDERHHTLALYFSRPLSRVDYVATKLASLAVALFVLLFVPEVVIQGGNAVAATDTARYVRDNADLLPPLAASSAVTAAFMASLSLAVAMQTSRRAFATGAVIAAFVIPSALGNIFVETLSGEAQRYSLLISPIDLLQGAVYWMFGADFPQPSSLSKAGLDGGAYFAAALGYTLIAIGFVYRGIRRVSV